MEKEIKKKDEEFDETEKERLHSAVHIREEEPSFSAASLGPRKT